MAKTLKAHPLTKLLMALAGLSLLGGLWAGVVRLGLTPRLPTLGLTLDHGPLMVAGFLGTLISLERAVTLEKLWAYGAPVFAGLGGLALLVGLPPSAHYILTAAGSLLLVSVFVFLWLRQPAGFLVTMGMGAFLWFVGLVLLYLGYPFYRAAPWWIGFLVLTIAGERLELSRLLGLPRWSRSAFILAQATFLAGIVVGLLQFKTGIRVAGFGLVALAAWLLRYDMVWRTVRQPDLPRFMAICLISGYSWLAIGGILWLLLCDFFAAGPYYDAMLHAIFVGFVFSMIFGHAPIMFPSVTGHAMAFQRAFYGHLLLLHLSLLLRLGGDLGLWIPGQGWGGVFNAIAILFFLANSVRAVKLGKSAG